MQSYRENVFEKLLSLEALDGFDKDGSEWSVVDANCYGEDGDFVHDNDFMGEQGAMYTTPTLLMRKGSVSSDNESCKSESDHLSSEEDQEELSPTERHQSSISDGDPIKRARI